MKTIVKLIPISLLGLSLCHSSASLAEETAADAPKLIQPADKISEAAKGQLQSKLKNPILNKGIYIKESGPTWVQYHKGGIDKLDPVSKPKQQ